jgi:hypothetical protein
MFDFDLPERPRTALLFLVALGLARAATRARATPPRWAAGWSQLGYIATILALGSQLRGGVFVGLVAVAWEGWLAWSDRHGRH